MYKTRTTSDGSRSVVGQSKEENNLGVIFDKHLNFKSHIMTISKVAYFRLYNIQKIRSNLTHKKATQTAIHAFVNQRLDYPNALLYGLLKCIIYNFQKSPKLCCTYIDWCTSLGALHPSSSGLALATSEMECGL